MNDSAEGLRIFDEYFKSLKDIENSVDNAKGLVQFACDQLTFFNDTLNEGVKLIKGNNSLFKERPNNRTTGTNPPVEYCTENASIKCNQATHFVKLRCIPRSVKDGDRNVTANLLDIVPVINVPLCPLWNRCYSLLNPITLSQTLSNFAATKIWKTIPGPCIYLPCGKWKGSTSNVLSPLLPPLLKEALWQAFPDLSLKDYTLDKGCTLTCLFGGEFTIYDCGQNADSIPYDPITGLIGPNPYAFLHNAIGILSNHVGLAGGVLLSAADALVTCVESGPEEGIKQFGYAMAGMALSVGGMKGLGKIKIGKGLAKLAPAAGEKLNKALPHLNQWAKFTNPGIKVADGLVNIGVKFQVKNTRNSTIQQVSKILSQKLQSKAANTETPKTNQPKETNIFKRAGNLWAPLKVKFYAKSLAYKETGSTSTKKSSQKLRNDAQEKTLFQKSNSEFAEENRGIAQGLRNDAHVREVFQQSNDAKSKENRATAKEQRIQAESETQLSQNAKKQSEENRNTATNLREKAKQKRADAEKTYNDGNAEFDENPNNTVFFDTQTCTAHLVWLRKMQKLRDMKKKAFQEAQELDNLANEYDSLASAQETLAQSHHAKAQELNNKADLHDSLASAQETLAQSHQAKAQELNNKADLHDSLASAQETLAQRHEAKAKELNTKADRYDFIEDLAIQYNNDSFAYSAAGDLLDFAFLIYELFQD